MTDYKKLVKALRERALRENEWYEHGGDIIEDAAAAIETLKAEVKDAINEGYNAGYTAGIGYCSFKRTKQPHWVSMEERLPKRGKWVREMNVYDEPFYHCSACGECFDSNRDDTYGIFNYCPNCGAKMKEVQDG